MRSFEHAWRVAATGAAFAFVFFGGGLLAVTVLPVLRLLPGGQRERARSIIHLSFRFYMTMLEALGLLRFEVEGHEYLRAGGGRIVVANHPSLLDVVMLIALIPHAQCIVKNGLWNHFLLGSLMRQAGYIRNDLAPEALLAACRAAIDGGESLIIFPEGTRSVPGKKLQFQRGFANIATMTGAPVQPVVITCDPPTLLKDEPWWRVPSRIPVFRLEMGKKIDPSTYIKYKHRSLDARKLVSLLEAHYADLLIGAQS